MLQESIVDETTENLWPADFDFGIGDVTPPVAVLKQQATLLGQKTRNLVTGSVINLGASRSGDEFHYLFYLSAPGLLGYRYDLFQVYHSLIAAYPAKIHITNPADKTTPVEKVATDEDDLKTILKEIFASETTRKVVQALITQSVATAS